MVERLPVSRPSKWSGSFGADWLWLAEAPGRTILRMDRTEVEVVNFAAGRVTVPSMPLIDRGDGGHLVVHPRSEVWERNQLDKDELVSWGLLVAATGAAMLECLPQLQEGCVNYWEAGNWSLHHDAEPRGPKSTKEHRRVHLHIFGRSPTAVSEHWQWGEAPAFPRFADRIDWARRFTALTPEECALIAIEIHRRMGLLSR